MDSKNDSLSSVPSFSGSGFSAVKSREELLGSISNSKIGQVLRDLSPPITLSEAQVEEINKLINNAELIVGDSASKENYIDLIDGIADICGILLSGAIAPFYQAFSIQADGKAIEDRGYTSVAYSICLLYTSRCV